MRLSTATGFVIVVLAATTNATGTPIGRLPKNPAMQAFVDRVLNMTDLHNDVIVVTDPSADGCAYATTWGGQQYIGIDPKCVGPLMRDGTYQWRAVGILCHEIGHLLRGDTTNEKMGNPVQELAADDWSGWAMYRLGGSLDQALTAARAMPTQDSITHPGRAKRVAIVESGWRKAANAAVQAEVPGSWWARLMDKPLPWLESVTAKETR